MAAALVEILAGGPGSGRHPYGGPKTNKYGAPIISEKARRAARAAVPAGKEVQDKAEAMEHQVALALGGVKSVNNKPFDVMSKNGKHMVEVKTKVIGKGDGIFMKSQALADKLSYAKRWNAKPHTVVVDVRSGTPQVYYKPGVGSFRIGSMQRVPGGFASLKNYIK